MKTKFGKIAVIILALVMCASIFTACGNDGGQSEEKKISEQAIRSALATTDGKLEGTLTIENGTAEDVLAFNYVVTQIYAEKLTDKSYVRNAANTTLSNPDKLTFGEYKVCKAFSATMQVIGIFNEPENEDEKFDSNAFIEDILSVICDGNAKKYGNWTISAVVDKASDSITVKAAHN